MTGKATKSVPASQPTRGRGRPKGTTRGTIATRSVTIDDERWAWLQSQPGGASETIRKLVDGARCG